MQLVALDDPRPREQSPTGMRVIKTHLASDFVPYSGMSKYLTVLCDPKEVVISSYYFLGGVFGVLSHVSIDQWLELFIGPDSTAKAWAQHTHSFWEWRTRPNVLVFNFREIKEQPRASIERVAALMEVALTDVQLSKVVERSSLEYMKAHESQFAPPQPPFTKEPDRIRMIRRGQSGGSDEWLSADQQREIDRVCRAELRGIGSEFPYLSEFKIAP
jgi:hypothetical protein